MISEMIHSASLIHDDVIDQSNFRRGKPSVNVLWNHRKVIISLKIQLKNAVFLLMRYCEGLSNQAKRACACTYSIISTENWVDRRLHESKITHAFDLR